jgi:hypothetical protein
LGIATARRKRLLELLAAVLEIHAVDAIMLFTADAKSLGNLPTRYLDLSVGPVHCCFPRRSLRII